MSRVFLMTTNVTVDPYPVYPIGMAVVAAALAADGHTVRQFDFLASGKSEERLVEALESFAPDYICLSMRNIDNADSFSNISEWYLNIAKGLLAVARKASKASVIVGGAAFSILPETILDYVGGDHGVVGEGERAVPDLIRDLAAGRAAPRIVSGSSPLCGAEMLSPLYDPALVEFYHSQSEILNLQTKRGCPHKCVYCTYPCLEGSAFRTRDPRAVADDVARLKKDLGVSSVFFTDSVFNDRQGHYLEVAEELARRDLGVRWSGFFRPQGIGPEEMALLKRSGLFAMELGTDAASDATLAELGKGFTFADVLEVNRAAVAQRIPCAHFIMFGGPGETEATVQEGLENIARLEHCVVFPFSGIRILPGTPLRRRAIQDGLLKEEDDLLLPVYYFSPQIDPALLNGKLEKAFKGRRDRIFPPPEGQKRMAVMHRFGYRGLLWDTLVRFPGRGEGGDAHAGA